MIYLLNKINIFEVETLQDRSHYSQTHRMLLAQLKASPYQRKKLKCDLNKSPNAILFRETRSRKCLLL